MKQKKTKNPYLKYSLDVLKERIEDQKAIVSSSIEDLEDAKREAAKALELNPSDALMLYNAACFYARIGEKQLAIKSLCDSFTAGYQNFEWAKRDTDFDSIRSDPGYIELMKGK